MALINRGPITLRDLIAGTGITIDDDGTITATGATVPLTTSISDTPDDAHIPTEKAVADYVAAHGGGGGSGVLHGSGAPSNGTGADGDFYIDTGTPKTIYGPKASGVWGSGTSLVGVAGATGATGAAGSTGATGATGPAGDLGATGADGRPAGFGYTWNTTTSAGDPGTGAIRANNASLASITAFYIDPTNDQSQAIGPELATWDDSTSTIKGRLKVYKRSAPQNFVLCDVTAMTNNSTYWTIAVTVITSNGSFSASDAVAVLFLPKGDAGSDGTLSGSNGDFVRIIDGSNNIGTTSPATALSDLGALPKAGGTMTGDLTLAGDPDSALKAATKQYVDSVAAGLDPKPSVRVASTGNLTLSGTQTIDGVAVIAGDRVLAKNQSTAAENGIYVVASGAWSRATDADAWTELPGAHTFVEVGTANAGTGWVCNVAAGGTLGSTSVTFVQFSQAGAYTAASGGDLSVSSGAFKIAKSRWVVNLLAPVTGDKVFWRPDFSGTIAFARAYRPDGTACPFTINIDGSPVTSLSGVSTSTSWADTTATGANTFTADTNTIDITLGTVTGTPTVVTIEVHVTR